MHAFTHSCTYTHIHIRTHMCMCTYTQIHKYTVIHTYVLTLYITHLQNSSPGIVGIVSKVVKIYPRVLSNEQSVVMSTHAKNRCLVFCEYSVYMCMHVCIVYSCGCAHVCVCVCVLDLI